MINPCSNTMQHPPKGYCEILRMDEVLRRLEAERW